MNKFLNKICLKKIIIFLFIFSIILLLFIYIKNPHKLVKKDAYDSNDNVIIKEVSFPLVQNINLNQDLLQKIELYFDNDSINNYDYTIKIYDDNEKILFEQKYTDYESNIVILDARRLKKNRNYKIIIDCDECEDVHMAIGKSLDKENSIENTNNNSLKMKTENYEKNYSYYLIPIIIIIFNITILLLSKINIINTFQKLNLSKKSILLILLIFLSILFMIFIFIKSPKKNVNTSIFNANYKTDIENVHFPIQQNILLDKQGMGIITLYLGDSSINEFDYNIKVTDKYQNVIFNHSYNNYESDIILIDAGRLKSNKAYRLEIDCDKCENVKMDIGKSIDSNNRIDKTKNKSLKIYINNIESEKNYYWYPLMAISICLILLPLSRSKKI